MNILCVCERGNVRSVTLASLLKDEYDHNAIAAGWRTNGPEPLLSLCHWADLIIVVEDDFRLHIPLDHDDKVVCCDLGPDRWHVPRHPHLEALLSRWLHDNYDDITAPRPNAQLSSITGGS